MRLPNVKSEMLTEVEKIYSGWFRIWNTCYVPKLIQQPKWFKKDKDLLENDVVMFQKDDPGPNSQWSLGSFDQLVRRRDGIIRRVIMKYQNSNKSFHRMTDRSIRSLVKIWSCDDLNVDEDLAYLQKKLSGIPGVRDLLVQLPTDGDLILPRSCDVAYCSLCCCKSHCSLGHLDEGNLLNDKLADLISTFSVDTVACLVQPVVYDVSYFQEDEVEVVQPLDDSLVGILNGLDMNLE